MKKTINIYDMMETFELMDRRYYTYDGLAAILKYCDEIDENMEFDPIAICCDCTEYGLDAVHEIEDLRRDYKWLYSLVDYAEDAEDIEEGLKEKILNDPCDYLDDYTEKLLEKLEERTTVLYVPGGNVIIFTF